MEDDQLKKLLYYIQKSLSTQYKQSTYWGAHPALLGGISEGDVGREGSTAVILETFPDAFLLLLAILVRFFLIAVLVDCGFKFASAIYYKITIRKDKHGIQGQLTNSESKSAIHR